MIKKQFKFEDKIVTVKFKKNKNQNFRGSKANLKIKVTSFQTRPRLLELCDQYMVQV